jgi:hypothetical protein
MTVKEIAEFTGKNKSTIGRWVAKCNSKSITEKNVISYKRGESVNYTVDEVEEILKAGSLSKDAVRILMDNARMPIATLEETKSYEPVNYEIIGKMIGMAVSAAMLPVVQQLQNISNPVLQIEQPKQDYFSLVGYTSLRKIKTTSSELRKMGMDLRKIAGSQGKELHKIPDERYGQVNSYPVEILDEYFSE